MKIRFVLLLIIAAFVGSSFGGSPPAPQYPHIESWVHDEGDVVLSFDEPFYFAIAWIGHIADSGSYEKVVKKSYTLDGALGELEGVLP